MSIPLQAPAPVPIAPAPAPVIGLPQTPAVAGATQALSLEALQAQAIDLNAQLAGLRAERDVLRSVINSSRSDPQFRASQASRYAELNQQMTRVDGQLDQVRAQIAQRQGIPTSRVGQSGQLVPPPPPSRRGPDPDMIAGLTFTLALFIVIPMSIAWARRVWRSKAQPQPGRIDEVLQRLERLDQAVDAVAIEIERVAEGQRFVTKVMVDRARSGAAGQAAGAAAAAAPAARSEAPAEPPVLALGPGEAPMEPIRVSERDEAREAVKVRR